MERASNDDALASFSKRTFQGRLRMEGSAAASFSLQGDGLLITGAFGEILAPYDSLFRAKLSKDSSGTIKIALGDLRLFLNIEGIDDTLALFARLEEWVAGSSDANRWC